MGIYQLKNKNLRVKVDNGELVSFTFNSEEIIHQKGEPGWRNSDTEMFPLIGATAPINYKVSTPRGDCIQDQHGLLRELEYKLVDVSKDSLIVQKQYNKNTLIKNSKFPDKSPEEILSWPYNFKFTKHFKLTSKGLIISFIIDAENDMPFMLGYHPAFKLDGSKSELIKTTRKEITIDNILNVGASAYPILKTSRIHLMKEKGVSVEIDLKGFENFMLWTEVDNMLCIEPITYYPNATTECLTPKMFNKADKVETFEVTIKPFN